MTTGRGRKGRAIDALARVKWSHWGVALLLVAAILWVLLRPDMWGPCLVLTAAAIALAVIGRDTE